MAQVPLEIIQLIRQMKRRLLTDLPIKRVLLFGSYAKGNFTENSDIDVCIIADGVQNSFTSMLSVAPKVVHIDPRIETVIFSSNEYSEEPSYGLLGEIKRTGIEI